MTNPDKIVLASGYILLKETMFSNVYEVVKTAKNCNYDSLGEAIKVGQTVIAPHGTYLLFRIDSVSYYMTNAKQIIGYFDE